MKGTERVDLIRAIAREIESRYDATDARTLFDHYSIHWSGYDPDYENFFDVLRREIGSASEEDLMLLAEHLAVTGRGKIPYDGEPPQIWKGAKEFRLFISHLAIHKDKAHRLKETLTPFHISAFVAHDDIEPSKEWQGEIERALFSMDAMLTLHTTGFRESVWAQQEIGCAIGRGVKILALRMDEDPAGFLGAKQAILRRGRTAADVAAELNALMINDTLTKERMAEVAEAFSPLDDEIPF